MPELVPASEAINASAATHAKAIATTRCMICGAAPGTGCTFARERDGAGYAHLRRVRTYLTSLIAKDPAP